MGRGHLVGKHAWARTIHARPRMHQPFGRRQVLLEHFGSLERVRRAELSELLAVPGLGRKVAQSIHAHLRERSHSPAPSGGSD